MANYPLKHFTFDCAHCGYNGQVPYKTKKPRGCPACGRHAPPPSEALTPPAPTTHYVLVWVGLLLDETYQTAQAANRGDWRAYERGLIHLSTTALMAVESLQTSLFLQKGV